MAWLLKTRRKQIHQGLYFGGLLMVATGLPLSVFMMSLGQLILGGNWLLEGDYAKKLKRFFTNPPALIFCSVYLLHLVGMLYSSDWDFGTRDLLTKLPVFTLTFIIASSRPLPSGWKAYLLLAFSASITLVSLFSLHLFFFGNINDFRDLSPFISHIRLSLMVALSVFILYDMAANKLREPVVSKWILWMVLAWHTLYLFLLQSLSGIIIFGVVLCVFMAKDWARKNVRYKRVVVGVGTLLVALGMLTLFWLWGTLRPVPLPDSGGLELYSDQGVRYYHDTDHPDRENGHLVYIYIAEEELREAWEERSDYEYYGGDERGQWLRFTLYRYLTSRGLRKDASGLSQMDEKEIEAVERGITNVYYTRWPGLLIRAHQTLFEIQHYRLSGDPSGHSLTQRMEFWKAAGWAIRQKPLSGWGTGDIYVGMHAGFDAISTPLTIRSWMRAHNQYLSLMMAFGLIGFIWVMFAWIYPAAKVRAFHHFPFMAFFVILLVSMLSEDTIETQAGLTFFVFFYNYFVFLREKSGKVEWSNSRKV
jgi:hypothetical protein